MSRAMLASDLQAQKSRRELKANMSAAVLTGIVNTLCTNPMDTFKTRWQVSASLPKRETLTLPAFGHRIMLEEGLWHGFWKPGLGPVLCGGTISIGCRYGLYPYARDCLGLARAWLLPGAAGDAADVEKIGPGGMFLAGLSAGMVGYFLAAPFLSVKVQMQCEAGRLGPDGCLETGVRAGQPPTYRNGAQALCSLAAQGAADGGGPPGALRVLWRGATVITMRGAMLSASQLAGYDATKTQLKKSGVMADGPALHLAASLAAALSATTCSAPLDVVLTLYQGAQNLGGEHRERYGSRGPLHCARVMLRESGPSIFMRGWVASFARLTPVCVGSLWLFEQMRKVVGIGYLD